MSCAREEDRREGLNRFNRCGSNGVYNDYTVRYFIGTVLNRLELSRERRSWHKFAPRRESAEPFADDVGVCRWHPRPFQYVNITQHANGDDDFRSPGSDIPGDSLASSASERVNNDSHDYCSPPSILDKFVEENFYRNKEIVDIVLDHRRNIWFKNHVESRAWEILMWSSPTESSISEKDARYKADSDAITGDVVADSSTTRSESERRYDVLYDSHVYLYPHELSNIEKVDPTSILNNYHVVYTDRWTGRFFPPKKVANPFKEALGFNAKEGANERESGVVGVAASVLTAYFRLARLVVLTVINGNYKAEVLGRLRFAVAKSCNGDIVDILKKRSAERRYVLRSRKEDYRNVLLVRSFILDFSTFFDLSIATLRSGTLIFAEMDALLFPFYSTALQIPVAVKKLTRFFNRERDEEFGRRSGRMSSILSLLVGHVSDEREWFAFVRAAVACIFFSQYPVDITTLPCYLSSAILTMQSLALSSIAEYFALFITITFSLFMHVLDISLFDSRFKRKTIGLTVLPFTYLAYMYFHLFVTVGVPFAMAYMEYAKDVLLVFFTQANLVILTSLFTTNIRHFMLVIVAMLFLHFNIPGIPEKANVISMTFKMWLKSSTSFPSEKDQFTIPLYILLNILVTVSAVAKLYTENCFYILRKSVVIQVGAKLRKFYWPNVKEVRHNKTQRRDSLPGSLLESTVYTPTGSINATSRNHYTDGCQFCEIV